MAAPGNDVLDITAFDAVVFDLDGVLTQTAQLHASAWKQVLDGFLERQGKRTGLAFTPFDTDFDYLRHIDGRPRLDGIRHFLRARGISLPEGAENDDAGRDTVHGLGNQKNRLFGDILARDGAKVYSGSLAFLHTARAAGLQTAVVSASRNTQRILAAAGLAHLLDACVDGEDAARLALRGKPTPDTFLHAAKVLGVPAARIIGVEDALPGVAALQAACFGLVIGVDRSGQAEALAAHGAGMIVPDLSAIILRARPPHWPNWHAESWSMPAPESDATWCIVVDGFAPEREAGIESLLAISNGRLGTRGALLEGNKHSQPGTVMAGVFDAPEDAPPGLLALPDWKLVSLTISGSRVVLDDRSFLAHRRVLDMRHAILWRAWWYRDAAGHVGHIQEARLASGSERNLLIQSISVSPTDADWPVTLDATLSDTWSGRIGRGATVTLTATASSRDQATPLVFPATRHVPVGHTWHVDRVVAASVSWDGTDATTATRMNARRALAHGLDALVADHCRAWDERWRMSDITISGDPAAQRAVRFAIHHLLAAVNPDDQRVSVGARLLTGNGYRGHVFWDTEIFMLPFYALTWPEAARSLLMYRHHTLPAARARAARHGYQGAFYAWESADTGEDVTPAQAVDKDGTVVPILTGLYEQHISADIAYGVWTYWRATGDAAFLRDAGAEIVIETARFWASRATRDPAGSHHIRGVIGPDEYHEMVDDNAYTNGMARWNLRTAEQATRIMAERWPENWRALAARIGLCAEEPAEWRAIADTLHIGLDPQSGLIEQFQGYFQLEDIDLASIGPHGTPPDVALGHDRIRRSQIIKQADVLMLLCLLWEEFPEPVIAANFNYYEKRCGHGSSLSPAMHALIAARLGKADLAMRHFRRAMAIDLEDSMGNDAGGVHGAALGGLWQAAVFGFGGLRITDQGPRHRAALPAQWQNLAFRVLWRGTVHEVRHDN